MITNLIRVSFIICAVCLVSGGIITSLASYSVAQTPQPTTSSTKKTSASTPRTTTTKSAQIDNGKSDEKEKEGSKEATEDTSGSQSKSTATPTPTPTPNEGLFGKLDIWTLLSWLVLGLVGLVGLGLAGWFVYYVLTNIWREKEANTRGFSRIDANQKDFGDKLQKLSQALKLQNNRIDQQQNLIQSLQTQSRASNIPQTPQFVQQPVYKPEPKFPVSVENYLNKVQNNGQKASADMIGGLLVQDPNKNEEFLIVRDSELADGLFYAVPSFARFSTKSDYLTYYQHYYACENPSGGTVWILAPTTVRRVENGWKLEEMGELDIRN